jgi:hypothetical protein
MSSCLAFLTVFLAMVPFPRTLKNSKAKQLRTQTMTLRALERAFLPSVSADRQSGQILHKIDEKSNARAEMKDCASVFLKRNYHIAFTTTKHHSIPRQQSKRHGGNTTLDAWIVGRIQEMHSPLHSELLVLFLVNRTICAAICKTRTEDIVKHRRNFKTTYLVVGQTSRREKRNLLSTSDSRNAILYLLYLTLPHLHPSVSSDWQQITERRVCNSDTKYFMLSEGTYIDIRTYIDIYVTCNLTNVSNLSAYQ